MYSLAKSELFNMAVDVYKWTWGLYMVLNPSTLQAIWVSI